MLLCGQTACERCGQDGTSKPKTKTPELWKDRSTHPPLFPLVAAPQQVAAVAAVAVELAAVEAEAEAEAKAKAFRAAAQTWPPQPPLLQLQPCQHQPECRGTFPRVQ